MAFEEIGHSSNRLSGNRHSGKNSTILENVNPPNNDRFQTSEAWTLPSRSLPRLPRPRHEITFPHCHVPPANPVDRIAPPLSDTFPPLATTAHRLTFPAGGLILIILIASS